MSRVQLALNVDDLDEAVKFYSKLFNSEPAKLKDGYANFDRTRVRKLTAGRDDVLVAQERRYLEQLGKTEAEGEIELF